MKGHYREMLDLLPISIRQANGYVGLWHRHHKATAGGKFALAVAGDDQMIHGVIIVALPLARAHNDGRTCEVTRLATDGTPNACSRLYGAAKRAARALGYRRMVTYTLTDELGASLRASGWAEDGQTSGEAWHRANRPRPNSTTNVVRRRWVQQL